MDAMTQCWVCSSPDHQLWKERTISGPLRPDDLQITDSNYGATLRLYRCLDCGFIYSDNAEVQELVALYEQLQDPSYEATADTRLVQMRWLISKGREARPKARTLLDIGAASGLLVAEARR